MTPCGSRFVLQVFAPTTAVPAWSGMVWNMCNMVRDTSVSIHHIWLVLLCGVAVSCGLTVPLTAEFTGSLLNLGAMRPCSADSDPVDLTDLCDDMEDSAMPAKAGSARLHPVISLPIFSDPAGWTWFSAPPVRPPIVLN